MSEAIAWVAMGIGIIGCAGATMILAARLVQLQSRVEDHLDRSAEDGHGSLR